MKNFYFRLLRIIPVLLLFTLNLTAQCPGEVEVDLDQVNTAILFNVEDCGEWEEVDPITVNQGMVSFELGLKFCFTRGDDLIVFVGSGQIDPLVEFTLIINGISCTYNPNGILPIDLVYFEHEVKGSNIILKWATASELDNKGFRIDQLITGKDWVPIGFVKGRGEASEYKFLTPIVPGVSYYRLYQEDFDGSGQYHKIIAVNIDRTSLPYIQYVDRVVFHEDVSWILYSWLGRQIQEGTSLSIPYTQPGILKCKTQRGNYTVKIP